MLKWLIFLFLLLAGLILGGALIFLGFFGISSATSSAIAPPVEVQPPVEATSHTMYQFMVDDGRFTSLLEAVDTAVLQSTFDDPSTNLTLFAPTDDAFAGLSQDDLLSDPTDVTLLLLYHIVVGEYTSAELKEISEFLTLEGESITINVEDGWTYVNDAKVIVSEIHTEGGIIYIIDAVLVPPSMLEVQ